MTRAYCCKHCQQFRLRNDPAKHLKKLTVSRVRRLDTQSVLYCFVKYCMVIYFQKKKTGHKEAL